MLLKLGSDQEDPVTFLAADNAASRDLFTNDPLVDSFGRGSKQGRCFFEQYVWGV